jgi:hypothetical protein
MTLNVTPLINGGYLVTGQDSAGAEGKTILRSERWDMVVHLRAHAHAEAEFDEAVEAFFAPLTDAADKAKALIAGPTSDYGSVTIGENVEGSHAREVELDEDGILLRILSEGNQNLLLWVGDDKLVAIQV